MSMHEDFPEALTDAQREILAQFELRAISTAESAPVVVVGQTSMRFAEEHDSSTSSSQTSSVRSSRMQEEDCKLDEMQSQVEQSLFTEVDRDVDEERVPAGTALVGHDEPIHVTRPEEKVCGSDALRGKAYLQGETSEDEELADALNTSDPTSNLRASYVGIEIPLYHHSKKNDDGLEAQAVPKAADNEEVIYSAQMAKTIDGAEAEKSLDQRSQELAERLVRLSAEVDAEEFQMDHSVPPPSEFF